MSHDLRAPAQLIGGCVQALHEDAADPCARRSSAISTASPSRRTAWSTSSALTFTRPGVPLRVRIWAERRDDAVRLWVANSGIGIAPAHQERVFRPFERMHGQESDAGTGLGLAIVRKTAERHGGAAGVSSDGGGSRFWIDLPSV